MVSTDEEELLSLDDDSDEERLSNVKRSRNEERKTKKLAPVAGMSMGSSQQDNSTEDASVSDSEEDANDTGNGSYIGNSSGVEITLSDEDEEEATSSNVSSSLQPSTSTQVTNVNSSESTSSTTASGRYGLRRKHKINYGEIENGPDVDDNHPAVKSKLQKKDVLDIFSVTTSKIKKYTHNPDLVDNFTRCKLVFMDGTDSSHLDLVSKFFEKCGQQFENLFVQVRYGEENYSFLTNVFKNSSAVSRLDYRYQNLDDAYRFLELVKNLTDINNLASLTSLKMVSAAGLESLRERHISILAEMRVKFQRLELGDALWEDVKSSTVEKLLEKQKSSLETLIIYGGFRGENNKEKILISLPKMEVLKTLCICPKYSFLSEIKNPYSKKARVITLEIHNKEEPFKIAIKFTCDLPNLRHLVLGNLIDIEDLVFSSVRKLTEFRCGSYWNLIIRFPTEGSRKSLVESTVTEFQFPDALKDPLFTVRVAKHFPHLKKVWLFLPSVPVLRAFFKAFENSNLEELYLKTQFDFEKTMESCLLPSMQDVLRKSRETETLLQTLREYKHFDEYMRYYNVELPVEADDLMASHCAGIGKLKSLKVLHLEHIPRTLLIPIPDDERKWYDHNCKFMSTTFGYQSYPLNEKCHKEILKLDLSEYIWKNIQIRSEFAEDFYDAGFVDIPDVQILEERYPSFEHSYDEDDEDLFTPVHKSTRGGAQVKIMPSMLLPSFKAKPEEM